MNKHKCEYYEGQILDVVVRTSDGSIRCRSCYEELKDSQVNPKALKQIRSIK